MRDDAQIIEQKRVETIKLDTFKRNWYYSRFYKNRYRG